MLFSVYNSKETEDQKSKVSHLRTHGNDRGRIQIILMTLVSVTFNCVQSVPPPTLLGALGSTEISEVNSLQHILKSISN